MDFGRSYCVVAERAGSYDSIEVRAYEKGTFDIQGLDVPIALKKPKCGIISPIWEDRKTLSSESRTLHSVRRS